ncbi:pimeloyl-ACP methyl ester esterase BioH [Aliidiomarina haloalkalitolerans]|uniref:Pimeloyl-[acyl-carrier protein] methyl ester esterase n=1 Tax=Aliidiomarina haloalkalitolerans TaxID=859059 RepID=A0A432VVN1_9GAMM|nr:pimeloyl-ACP methyl ester esterase BioH [Aliidiomarina haloalkalitolerans]RUO20605.1 pimeloyl-[acyl-carrier protein] methyl ester esterase [Aliidiomarina haloalkalitolerans]
MPNKARELSLHVQKCQQTGNAPTLVLLHGWGLNKEIWTPVLPRLAEFAHIVTVDLPGFGHSSWQSENSQFDHACHRLMANLAHHLDGPFYIAGWSLGGLFATQIALDYPTYVRRVMTIASSPCFMARESVSISASAPCSQTEAWPGIKRETLEAFRYQLSTNFQKTLERFLAVQALGSPAAKEEIKTMRALLASCPEPAPEALVAGLRWLAEVDLREDLSALQVPLVRLYGRRDSLVPIATSAAITRYLPSHMPASIQFDASAHAPFITEIDRFVDTLNDFVLE